jgi:hypothetical protein
MSKKFILPPSLKYPFEQSEFPGDLNLREIREHAEKNKIAEVSFYQAVVIALLDQRNYFVMETLRYAKQYGQLPQEDGTATTDTETQEEVSQEESKGDFPALRVVTDPDDKVKFSKKYD